MAIIICPNCGEEISDRMSICPHCKTPISVILSQKPKRKRTIPLAVPILSVLDGLVLVGTVGLLTWGVMNPAIAASFQTESVSSSTDLAAACETISTLQRNAAKNYNRYHPVVQEAPAEPITEVSQDAGPVEPEADSVAPLSSESEEPPEQNGTPQQAAQATQQPIESTPTASPSQTPAQAPVREPVTETEEPQIPKSNTESANASSIAPTINSDGTADINGRPVYVTPTGARWHYDNNCNQGNYYVPEPGEIKRRNLTPCDKCVT